MCNKAEHQDKRHPKLAGLEGRRVEITWPHGYGDYKCKETAEGMVGRYQIGQSTGPHHVSLLLHNRASMGGEACSADMPILAVRIIR